MNRRAFLRSLVGVPAAIAAVPLLAPGVVVHAHRIDIVTGERTIEDFYLAGVRSSPGLIFTAEMWNARVRGTLQELHGTSVLGV